MLKNKKIIIILWIAAVLVNVKSIFVDFDVDSTYAIAMSYRFLIGDRIFEQMWEPHQTSAFLLSFLEWIYLSIKGDVFGIAIYLQTISVIVYGLCTYVFYVFLKEHTEKYIAHIAAIIFFSFRAKQIVLLEFSNMFLLCSMFLLIFLVNYFKTKRIRYLFLCSFALSIQVLSYPTAVLVFIVVILIIFMFSTKKIRDSLIVFFSCFVMGCTYIGFFVIRIGTHAFVENISNIMNGDSSHLKNDSDFWLYYKEIVFGVTWILACLLITFFLLKIRQIISHTSIDKTMFISLFGIIIGVSEVSLLIIGGIRGTDAINFWLYVYGILFLLLIVMGSNKLKYCTTNQKYIYVSGILISFASFFAVLILTNLPIITVVNYLVLGAIVSLIPLFQYSLVRMVDIFLFIIMICATIIMHRGIAIRDYSSGKSLIFGIENIVRKGPSAGVVCSYISYYKTNSDISEWNQLINETDSLLIVTSGVVDPVLYMYKPVKISHYSTICTTTYDDTLLKYWEKYPEKLPSIIAVECWYGDMNIDGETWVMNFIEKNYSVAYEGNYWRYYRIN